MIPEVVQQNIDEIIANLNDAKKYDGYKMSVSTDTYLHGIRGRVMRLSDNAIDFFFERTNSNARVGTYKITLKCSEEIEDYINQYQNQELE
jgi:hypothetical protein